MITQAELKALEQLWKPGVGVLSVYLNPAMTQWPALRAWVRDRVKALQARAESDVVRKALQAEWRRVDNWFHRWDPDQGVGLALFSSLPHDLWRVFHLAVPVRPAVHFSETAYTTPLLDLFDEYERYSVVLVEKQRARLFLVYLGEIEEQEAVLTSVPQRHKAGGEEIAGGPRPRRMGNRMVQSTIGGDVNPRVQRHHDEVVRRHLRTVAQNLGRLARERRFDRLIISGPKEARAAFERQLPKDLHRRLVDRLALRLDSTPHEVLQASRTAEERVEREREAELVKELVVTAAKGDTALLGVEPALHALHARDAHLLVMPEDWRSRGVRCTSCGLLSVTQARDCPKCGVILEPVDDLGDLAAEQALLNDVPVEFVHGPASEQLVANGTLGVFRLLAPKNSRTARRRRRAAHRR